jgi:hypothetical protein
MIIRIVVGVSLKSKSESKNMIFTLLTDFNISGINLKFIRYDDSGEIKPFYDSRRANENNITFEFSGPRTPKHNSMVRKNSNVPKLRKSIIFLVR